MAAGDGEFLAGDSFGVADLTAASLFYPIVVPTGFAWIERTCRRHRHPERTDRRVRELAEATIRQFERQDREFQHRFDETDRRIRELAEATTRGFDEVDRKFGQVLEEISEGRQATWSMQRAVVAAGFAVSTGLLGVIGAILVTG